MKRVDFDRRIWLERVCEERTERSLVSKNKHKIIRKRALSRYSESAKKIPFEKYHEKKGGVLLLVPENLDLINEYDHTIRFIEELRKTALLERRPVKLSFEKTNNISPAALLVLVAEVSRCMYISRGRVTGTYPDNEQLERVLQDTGFFDLLGVANRLPKENNTGAQEYIKFQSGTRAVGPDAYHLEQALLGDSNKLDKGASGKLYRGITEAMTNVVQHAYIIAGKTRIPRMKNQWWMVGHINRENQELMVMFYDQGVGIPATLPLKYPNEIIQGALAKLGIIESRDGDLILAGMEIGRTRTDLAHQGKGLNDLRAFIDQSGTGFLRILSRFGEYTYSASREEKTNSYNHSLGGTLIQWTVSLPSVITERDETKL